MSSSGERCEAADVTRLLELWRAGDRGAFEQASAAIYPELRRIARAYLRRERAEHTLQPTALVHEAFLRLIAAGQVTFDSRREFYGLAAQVMRRVLVDHARAVKAQKRGGASRVRLPLDAVDPGGPHLVDEFLALHEAIERLDALNPRKARIVELRHFGGLTLEETASLLGISVATAHREQRLAEAWLAEVLLR